MKKERKLADRLLNGVATLSEVVAAATPIDSCWAWTYKPPLPASMQREIDEKKALESKEQ